MPFLNHISYFIESERDKLEVKNSLTPELHCFGNGQITASDYGLAAVRKLNFDFIADSGAIIFTSEGSDFNGPQTSVWLHKQLLPNKKNVLCLDLPGGCTGFINQLMVANSLIESGNQSKVLGILGEIVTRVIHPDDKNLLEIFSDAGAAVVVDSEKKGFAAQIGKFVMGTDSTGFESLIVRNSGTREPINLAWLQKYQEIGGLPFGRMVMDEKAVFMFVFKTVPKLVNEVLKINNQSIEDIDLFIFHQANAQLLDMLQKKLKIPNHKFFSNFKYVKNSVSCSIPIAIKQAIEQGRIKEGNKVLIAGFGIGFTYGGTVLYY